MSKYTLASGYHISHQGPITSKTIVALIDALESVFGEGHRFVPESAAEGGLLWAGRPGQDIARGYKSVRFHLQEGTWPWIGPDILDEWRTAEEGLVIWKPPHLKTRVEGSLFYKAFAGAPCWTQEEILLLKEAFAKVDILCTGKLPTVKELCSKGSLS